MKKYNITFTPRLYQETIFYSSTKKNSLVVIPTGLGKTNIFIMLAVRRLNLYPKSKILFLAPTKPLVEQHIKSFQKMTNIDENDMVVVTGKTPPKKRKELMKNAKIIFSTPQTVENDVINKNIDLYDISLLGIDEAHRTVGNYAYVFIAEKYNQIAKNARIMALTASPGSDIEKIKEICQNLYVENVEVKKPSDSDVKKYIHKTKTEWIKVKLPEKIEQINKYLKSLFEKKQKELHELGTTKANLSSKGDILKFQAELRGMVASGEKDMFVLKSLSVTAQLMKISHAMELLETQGVNPFHDYISRLFEQSKNTKVKAVSNLCKEMYLSMAYRKSSELKKDNIVHPKITKLREILYGYIQDKTDKVILFTQYRISALDIKKELDEMSIKSKIFVGQAKKGKTGLSQKKQKEMLDDFRESKFNVLIATSVGEEGLDIPEVDMVLFYEPIPSAIRHIQRRGRTGRHKEGKVIILQSEGTRDEGYKWSAHHKERRMLSSLDKIKKEFSTLSFKKTKIDNDSCTLKNFMENNQVKIIADYREKSSAIIQQLMSKGIDIRLEQLEFGDYLLSPETIVELKTPYDFVTSILDGRIFDQVSNIKQKFRNPILIIQGEENLYSQRNVSPSSVQGALVSIAVGYGVPILQTKNPPETANIMRIIAEKHSKKDNYYMMHLDKPKDLKKQLEFVITSFPNIGIFLAKELLKKFGSVSNIINASKEELQNVPGVGKVIAEMIKEISSADYNKKE